MENQSSEEEQHQRQRPEQRVSWNTCLLLLLALLIVGGAVVYAAVSFFPGVQSTAPTHTTITGNSGGLNAAQEAVYRGQDLNEFRLSYWQQQGKMDGRNLGMGEIVAQFDDHTELLLHMTPIFWGSAAKHSEEAAMEDIQTFLSSASMANIKTLQILIVSQYNMCNPCKAAIQKRAGQLRSRLPVNIQVQAWEVVRFIDPYNPKTWIAPKVPADMKRVLK